MSDHIPPRQRLEDTPPIKTQRDLYDLWRMLMGELGFGSRSVWVMFIDADDRCAPGLLQIEDLESEPDDRFLDGLMHLCANFATDEPDTCRVAMLLTRPGTYELTSSDLTWATRLRDAARRASIPCAPLHLANDQELRVLTPDDIGLAEPA